jgi:multiple sugar transport system substrate-binding protein
MKHLRMPISLLVLLSLSLAACQPQTVEVEVTREVEVEVQGETIIEEVEVPVEVEVETIVEVPAEFDWRQFEGSTVNFLYAETPGMGVSVDIIDEFEELTGITVKVDPLPWPEALTKRVLELSSESSTYDVMVVWMFQEKTQYLANDWYTPLNQYIHNPSLTSPDYDWDDFGTMGKAWADNGEGDVYAIPTKFDLWGMFARTSALEKADRDFPLTIDELFETIEAVHDPDNGFYGISARGIQGQNALYHSWLHHGYGGSWFDSAGLLNTKGEPSIDAVAGYARLLSYGPPGVEGFAWNDGRQAFTQGQAAFYFTGYGGSWAYMQDPEVVVEGMSGDVSYGFLPSTDPNKPVLISSQLGAMINPYAENKEAGWLLLQWLTDKDAHLRALLEVGDTWTRDSTYNEQAFLDSKVYIKEWADGVRTALSIPATNILPPISNAQEWRDEYGLIMNQAVQDYPNLDRAAIGAQLEATNQRFVDDQLGG